MKRKRNKSPCQNSLQYLRKNGWMCGITEKWNKFAGIRQDLFGFIDILSVKDEECLAVQTTTSSAINARIGKIKMKCKDAAIKWLRVPSHRIAVHGWAKRGPRGRRKIWTLREVEVTKEMLTAAD